MLLRFHLDESVHASLGAGLRRRGLDVTLSAEVGLLGATDAEQLEFATAHGRVLVTYDDDFLRLHSACLQHAGIVYSRQRHRTLGQLILAIMRLARTRTAEDVAETLTFL